MVQGALGNTILIGLWYALLFVIVPAICLHCVVRKRRLVWRLAFYQICGFTNLCFWGYLFAFLRIWPVFAFRIVLVFLPIALKLIFDRKRIFLPIVRNLEDLSDGITGWGLLRKKIFVWLKEKIRRFFDMYLRRSAAQILILLVLSAFVVWYFGYFKLHFTTYASSDEATHLYWIHALMTDQAFPVGLYPHLMHFIVAVISSFLRISAMYVNHYLSIVMILAICFSLFCALKTMVRSKGAAIFGTGVFIIANLFVTGDRYQMTLPMEFGFIPMLMVIVFLQEYRKKKDRLSWWMIAFSLFCAAQIHLTVFVFGLIFVVAYLLFLRPLNKLKTLAAVLLALGLSIAPFAAGILLGYQMEQSLGWAVSLMENRDDYYEGNQLSGAGDAVKEEAEETQKKELNDTQKEWKQVHDLPSFFQYVLHLLTEDVVTGAGVSLLLYLLEIFAILYGIFRLIISRKEKKREWVLVIAVIWFLVFLTHAIPKATGSSLADSGRMQILLSLVSAMLFAVPVQAVSDLFRLIPRSGKWREHVVLALSMLALAAVWLSGNVKKLEDMEYSFVLQPASFRLTDDVINENVKDTWTVISPVNDLVGIRCYGYHYEIIDLLREIEKGQKEFFIPTPDIYVVVEKIIPHFDDGATTFGLETKALGRDLIEEHSDLPDASLVPESFEEIGLTENEPSQNAYYAYRQATMSKLIAWMNLVKTTYPSEVSVYSEDESCVVYHIAQDPYFLLNLALDYRKEAQ